MNYPKIDFITTVFYDDNEKYKFEWNEKKEQWDVRRLSSNIQLYYHKEEFGDIIAFPNWKKDCLKAQFDLDMKDILYG